LAKSILKYHPEINIYVLIVDEYRGYVNPKNEPFNIISIDNLNIKAFHSFCFKYNATELCCALKPYLFDHLIKNFSYQKIIYLDSDILVLDNLNETFKLLNKYSILVTPHIFTPYKNNHLRPNESILLKTGVYNLGFIAISNSLDGNNFISWWKNKLYTSCKQFINNGQYLDQLWGGFILSMFNNVKIIKDLTYNVAYWNLHERKINKIKGSYCVNNRPIKFFHFSGIKLEKIEKLSVNQNRYKLNDFKYLPNLFYYYQNLLIDNGYNQTIKWPYSYGYYDNNKKILAIENNVYYLLNKNIQNSFGNPFNASNKNSFYNWLHLKHKNNYFLTNLEHEMLNFYNTKSLHNFLSKNPKISFILFLKYFYLYLINLFKKK